MDIDAFLHMGGYGPFIWSAYGISALVLAGILWQSTRHLKQSDAELDALRDREDGTAE